MKTKKCLRVITNDENNYLLVLPPRLFHIRVRVETRMENSFCFSLRLKFFLKKKNSYFLSCTRRDDFVVNRTDRRWHYTDEEKFRVTYDGGHALAALLLPPTWSLWWRWRIAFCLLLVTVCFHLFISVGELFGVVSVRARFVDVRGTTSFSKIGAFHRKKKQTMSSTM